MKKKEPVGVISLQVKAQEAVPAPPIGPALGQRGLNIMDFCRQFNERSKALKDVDKGEYIPVKIKYFADKSFEFIMNSPPVSALVKKFAKIAKGSVKPGSQSAGSIQMADVVKIAKIKMNDMNVDTLKAAISMVTGTARSMGIEVVGKADYSEEGDA